jgi:hypothetical protein
MLADYIHYTSLSSNLNTLLIVHDLFIKFLGFPRELPCNPITLAKFLLIFFNIPFSFQVLTID